MRRVARAAAHSKDKKPAAFGSSMRQKNRQPLDPAGIESRRDLSDFR
jgi:hypothetical protein